MALLNLCLLILLTLLFFFRIIRWLARIDKVRKTMPVVPVLFPSRSKYRRLIPKSWQTYHRDWHMEYGRDLYNFHNSDVFALISLFEYDNVFVSDPKAVLEMKVTGTDRYQIDLLQTSQVPSQHPFPNLVLFDCCLFCMLIARLRFMDQILFLRQVQNGNFIEKLLFELFLKEQLN